MTTTKYYRRLGHKKSRNGCLRCKARRVKCDEKRPCSGCSRHNAACSLLNSPPREAASTSRRPSQTVHSTSGQGVATSPAATLATHFNSPSPTTHTYHRTLSSPGDPSPTLTSPQLNGLSPAVEDGGSSRADLPADWLQSLQLMHHYCTDVCKVFSCDGMTDALWRISIPRAAYHDEFLMHGIIAISALHYAVTNPSERQKYSLISAHHQNRMLPHFATRLNDISEENCEGHFFLACVIFLLSLCWVAHHETLERPTGPKDVAQSFVFLKGIKGILNLRPIQQWRQSEPLAQLLRPSYLVRVETLESDFLTRLDKVTGLARQLPMTDEVINEQTACILALEALRATYGYKVGEERPGYVWGWPIYVPDLFIEMLGQGHPTALIVVSYFAALARPYEYRNWASLGWSQSVIGIIEANLEADQLSWIEWPKRCILENRTVDGMGDVNK